MHTTQPFEPFVARLREFITARGVANPANVLDASSRCGFADLALELFHLQCASNAAYAQFCRHRGRTPDRIKSWWEAPAIPTHAFKDLDLTSIPADQRVRVFHSSGTTQQRPSRHWHSTASLALYEQSLLTGFTLQPTHSPAAVEVKTRHWLFLTPPPDKVPHSSLVHMFDTLANRMPPNAARFLGQADDKGVWRVATDEVCHELRSAREANQPVWLMGTAFNFVNLIDDLQARGESAALPPGSWVLETGGYKGRSRVLAKPDLHRLITQHLGVPEESIVCEYGMSELSSQAYSRPGSSGWLHFPPWARARIVSPETGREVGVGEVGLLQVFDLANVYSVMAVQTEDLARRHEDGFELLGRATDAEPRGCSLMSLTS